MMNRESKYRGKRLDNGQWAEGDKVAAGPCVFIFYADGPEQVARFDEDNQYEAVFRFVEVDPATVGQWTGLKDKNGREIWEGDVCSVGEVYISDGSDPDPLTRIIQWDAEHGGFDHFRIDGKPGGSGPRGVLCWGIAWSFGQETIGKYYAVIGTIHDAPDPNAAAPLNIF